MTTYKVKFTSGVGWRKDCHSSTCKNSKKKSQSICWLQHTH